jgi:hypothetical protein
MGRLCHAINLVGLMHVSVAIDVAADIVDMDLGTRHYPVPTQCIDAIDQGAARGSLAMMNNRNAIPLFPRD